MTDDPQSLLDPTFLKQVQRLGLRARRVLRADRHGARRSRRAGTGLMFAGHRGYVAGDDLRHLDWDLLARLDRPFMKQFEHEPDLTVHLLIDATKSMDFGRPTKFLFAARLAAVLGYIALSSLDRVVVGFVDADGVRLHGPVRGRAGFHSILRFLESGRAQGGGSLERGLRIHAAAGAPGLTVLFSDFFDEGLPRALLPHRFRRHNLALVQVLCPDELEPTLDGDLKLIDAEEAGVTEITVGPRELGAYADRLAAHRDSLRRFALRHSASMLTLPSNAELEQVVWDHLLRATLVERR